MPASAQPARPHGRSAAIGVCALMLCVAGCGASQRSSEPDNTRQDRVELEEPTLRIGPEPTSAQRGDAAAGASASEPATSQMRTSEPTNAWRRDGRPAWWLAEAVRDGGRLTLSAEAIADDVLAARRAAVDAGRAALAREVGVGATDERVEAITVRRLGADRPGGARYVGYVLISARIDG